MNFGLKHVTIVTDLRCFEKLGPGFLSSATWPLLPKNHYDGLNQLHGTKIFLGPDRDPDHFAPSNRAIVTTVPYLGF